jgi:hypothetical protein
MGSEDLVERRIGLFQSEQGLEEKEWRDLRQRIMQRQIKVDVWKILQKPNPGANGLGYG